MQVNICDNSNMNDKEALEKQIQEKELEIKKLELKIAEQNKKIDEVEGERHIQDFQRPHRHARGLLHF